MELIQKYLKQVHPLDSNKFLSKECVFSFNNAESDGGIYISLTNFCAVSEEYLQLFYTKTENHIFLHHKQTRSRKDVEEPEPKKPTTLSIGTSSGFSSGDDFFEFVNKYSLFILPENIFHELSDDLPAVILKNIEIIKATPSVPKFIPWVDDTLWISAYAEDLLQLNNDIKIPASGWKCAKCDLSENLWLNLTDGSILCGRRYFDGSGGNNHAADMYEITKYPLAVKLGTITSDGRADVYSYPEDTMVIDPFLVEHLNHFGINVKLMEKTEKTMTELEIALNENYEWKLLTETDSKLTPVYGPELTGMRNLGNSCYIASVMQVFFAQPEISKYFLELRDTYNNVTNTCEADNSFIFQMIKLAYGLSCGIYSSSELADNDQHGIRPVTFKRCVGANHREFSSNRQQDAHEFYIHILNLLTKNSRMLSENVADRFSFKIEERYRCSETNRVRYSIRDENTLSLFISLSDSINKSEVDASREGDKSLPTIRHKIPLQTSLDNFIAEQEVTSGNSVCGYRRVKIATYPQFLLVQIRRFTISNDWTPIKLDVEVEMPDELNLDFMRGSGLQPGEIELPTSDQTNKTFTFNEEIVAQLESMGFSSSGVKRAVYATKNQGAEVAMNWIMEHMDDADFNSPFSIPGSDSVASVEISPENINSIVALGFSSAKAAQALKQTDNILERAVEWIFSHPEEPEEPEPKSNTSFAYDLKPAHYKLRGIISHMGTSTFCGHYVCHILKGDTWYIFNDEKVAKSNNPPRGLGYLYLYERKFSSKE